MAVHISDSVIFKNAWGTPVLRQLFCDTELIKGWIATMAILAETQAEYGLIPEKAARHITETRQTLELDAQFLKAVRLEFEQTNHSLLGLIRALQRHTPENSGEWWCYGATVQDITDTHTASLLLKVHQQFTTDLNKLSNIMSDLAQRYRDTPMCGRTHGQPGLAITFGYKAAGWLDECIRHQQRLINLRPNIATGQLAGGVGSLSSFGDKALDIQLRFLTKLGLTVPDISWTSARDRLAEWLNLLMLVTASADRIGHEIYNLQRPEIAELSEGFISGTVGSITMPQKRNPEISEHLGTLARYVRHQAEFMNENLVHDHERDGRSWKGEWAILPASCLATGKTLVLLQDLLQNLQVNSQRMQENLRLQQDFLQAEQVMLQLAPYLGKQSAHNKVYNLALQARELGQTLQQALLTDPEIEPLLASTTIDSLFSSNHNTGQCVAMVDQVVNTYHDWQSNHLGGDLE